MYINYKSTAFASLFVSVLLVLLCAPVVEASVGHLNRSKSVLLGAQPVLPENPWQHLAAAVTDFRWVSVANPDEPDEGRLQWYTHPQSHRFGGIWIGELEIWNSTDASRSFLPYTVKMTSGYFEWVAFYEDFIISSGPSLEFRDMHGRTLHTTLYYGRINYPVLRIPNFVTVQPGRSVKLKIVATAHRQYQFGRLQPSYPTELNLLTLTDGQRRTLLDITGTGFPAPRTFDEVRAIMQAADRAVKAIKVPDMRDPAWAHVPLRPEGNASLGTTFSGRIGKLAR